MFWSHSLSIPKWPNVSHPEPVRRLAFSVLALEQPLVLKWSWRGTMVRLCSYFAYDPLGSSCLSSPYTGPQQRDPALGSHAPCWPSSSCLFLFVSSLWGSMATLLRPWHLWRAGNSSSVSPGPWCRAVQGTFRESSTGSCHVQLPHPSLQPWLQRGLAYICSSLRLRGLSRAENITRVFTPANDPSLPHSQACARWLLAPAGTAVPCTECSLTFPSSPCPQHCPGTRPC